MKNEFVYLMIALMCFLILYCIIDNNHKTFEGLDEGDEDTTDTGDEEIEDIENNREGSDLKNIKSDINQIKLDINFLKKKDEVNTDNIVQLNDSLQIISKSIN